MTRARKPIKSKEQTDIELAEALRDSRKQPKKIGFVLGNGESRRQFSPVKLQAHGQTFACNAAYRDFSPDYLVAVDPHMVQEIIDQVGHKRSKFFLDEKRYLSKYENEADVHFIDFNLPGQSDSGNMAAALAASEGYTDIYLIGFDFISRTGYQNNIYKSTQGYKTRNEQHVLQPTEESWYNRAVIICSRYPNVTFYRVNGNRYVPPIREKNYINITPDDLKQQFRDIESAGHYDPAESDYTPVASDKQLPPGHNPFRRQCRPSPFLPGPPKPIRKSPF